MEVLCEGFFTLVRSQNGLGTWLSSSGSVTMADPHVLYWFRDKSWGDNPG